MKTQDQPDLLPGEILRPIRGFEGTHAVTNFGRVWSYSRKIYGKTGGKRTSWVQHGGWRKPMEQPYQVVRLKAPGKKVRRVKVSHLVAEEFLPPPKPGQTCVNHKDLNKKNDHYSNLEWCTHAENTEHARANGAYATQSSRYRGVSYHKRESVWVAFAMVNKKPLDLGCYQTEIEAAQAYANYAVEHGLPPQRIV